MKRAGDAAAGVGKSSKDLPLNPLTPAYGMSVTNFAAPRTTRSSERQTVTIPTVRVTEDLGRRIGAYSVEHGLTTSETVRVLLEAGLNELEGDDQ